MSVILIPIISYAIIFITAEITTNIIRKKEEKEENK